MPRISDEDELEEPRYAWVGWRYAVAALEAGTLTGGSGSDNRVLRIAASLSELGVPVDLADAVTGLDRHNLALVLAAVSHANGSHEHKDYAAERPADGSRPVVNRPGFDAYLLRWEGASHAKQVRPGDPGQSSPSGA